MVQFSHGGHGVGHNSGGCAGVAQHDLGSIGQGLQLGHGVRIGAGFAVHHVAEQGSGGVGHTCEPQVSVVGGGGVGCAVAIGAVGGIEHFVEGVDDGLQLGRRVGFVAIDHSRGQCVVDGGEVVSGHAAHAGVGVGGEVWRGALGVGHARGVELREAAQGAQRGADVVDQGLQLVLRVGLTAVVVFAGDGS